jgi:hypothetical protein
VASHLTHIYTKLGVRSRTELARACTDNSRLAGQSSDVLTFPRDRPSPSVEDVPGYLVETFLARGDAVALEARDRRARSAAKQLTRTGTPVRFDGAIHVPGDEMCFYIFDAPSGRDAALAAHRAELDPVRVVEAVAFGNDKEEK